MSGLNVSFLLSYWSTFKFEFSSTNCCDEKKLLFLNNALSKSEKTGIQKTRVYSTTSQNNKTGGVTIYLPSCFDNIIKVLYQSKDNSEIPRYLSLVCKLTGGPNIILSAVYGSPQNAKEKLSPLKYKTGNFCVKREIVNYIPERHLITLEPV